MVFASVSTLVAQQIHPLSIPGGLGLARAEYYFDQDPGIGNGHALPVDPKQKHQRITHSISTEGLSRGAHKLFIRMLDTEGQWSVPHQHTVFVVQNAFQRPVSLARGAWQLNSFFDEQAKPLPAAGKESESFAFELNTAPLQPGSHSLEVRFQDEYGNWGLPEKHAFFVLPEFKATEARLKVFENQKLIDSNHFPLSDAHIGNAFPLQTGPIVPSIPESSFLGEWTLILNHEIEWLRFTMPFQVEKPSLSTIHFSIANTGQGGGGNFRIFLPDPLAMEVLIQQSEDLVSWENVGVIPEGQDTFEFPMEGAMRFFRAMVQ